MKTSRIIVRMLLAVTLAGSGLMARAAEIAVISTVAHKDAYIEMMPAFERASGHKVVTQWVPTVEVLRRIKAGEEIGRAHV